MVGLVIGNNKKKRGGERMRNIKDKIKKLEAKRQRELSVWSGSPLGVALVNAEYDAKIDKLSLQLANSKEVDDDLLYAFEQFLG